MIPFNKIYHNTEEFKEILNAIKNNSISGRGIYSKKCENFFKNKYAFDGFLTTSCTASLEIISLLSELKPGDEVLMPSYTFVGSATPFVLRGCVPVFVDIRPDTQNIDESKIEENITSKTKAILVVHYAGVSCELDIIKKICSKYKLILIEDAAQGIESKYYEKYLGTIGDFSTFSFHDTKNITSGEGGLIVINKKKYLNRSEIILEKGTNRSNFLRGKVDKYTWIDIGSSFVQSEITAAFLFAQLKKLKYIQKRRKDIWQYYLKLILQANLTDKIKTPFIPSHCKQNYHMFYILFESEKLREHARLNFINNKIQAVSHYIPLHSSRAGKKFGKIYNKLTNTDITSKTILRLPIYPSLSKSEQEKVISTLYNFFKKGLF